MWNAPVICNGDYYRALVRVFFFQNTVTKTQDNKHPVRLWVIQGNKVFQLISDGTKRILNGTGHQEEKATKAATE